MKSIQPQPYKLFNKIQNYEWGTKNQEAFIPQFLGIEPIKDLPYGELWIGAHPKASSEIEIDGIRYPLNFVIENFAEQVLGKNVSKRFGGKLPFLLKVLSAAQALSIQLHPNKTQAVALHKKDPENYPDDNHKPEVAIALDSLTALAGFKPAGMIKDNFQKYSDLQDYIGKENYEILRDVTNDEDLSDRIKIIYKIVMKNAENKEKLDMVIQGLKNKFNSRSERTMEEDQFLIQQKLYGNDVGLLSFFFLNIIQLKPGRAIFTDAGVPHAYIKGNIIECMANSDNVVRAGLTNKFKDVDTLLEIMNYSCGEFNVINKEQRLDEIVFKTSASEFEVTGFMKGTGSSHKIDANEKPSIVLIEHGTLEIEWKVGDEIKSITFSKGDSFLCPAVLTGFLLSSKEDSKYYIVTIPNY